VVKSGKAEKQRVLVQPARKKNTKARKKHNERGTDGAEQGAYDSSQLLHEKVTQKTQENGLDLKQKSPD